jgi:uncharacterized phage protein gp47/JayE
VAPVSIYRAVADILAGMLTSIQQSGSALTDFSAGSVGRTLYEGVASELSLQSLMANQMRLDMFISTATGDALDDKASDFGVPRLQAVPATGLIRMSQVTPGTTVFLPAGSVPLLTQQIGDANPSISVITTQDATLPQGTAYIDIPASAVDGGVDGNIAAGAQLVPTTPINGISSANGIVVSPAQPFAGGVDEETDDAYRARIPIAVQGRVPGKAVSFLAAATGINGVVGADVVPAGAFDGAIVVQPPNIEVFYSGSSGLLSAVQQACSAATTLGQTVTAYVATSDRIIFGCTVTAYQGTDTVALQQAVIAAAQGVVNIVWPGGTAYLSSVIQAIHNVLGVISVNVPFADFRRSTETAGTAHDITEQPNAYPSLATADCAVTVNLVPLPT